MKKLLLIITLFSALKSQAALCDHALNFTGGVCFVTCGGNPTLTPTTRLTVEAWIFLTDTLLNQKIAGNVSPFSNSGYELGVDAGQLYCEVKDINGVLYDFKAGTIPGNVWTHVAFSYSAGDQFLGYINGNQIYVGAAGIADIGNTGSTDFVIGAAPWDQTYFNFFGKIDEVRVYNSVRPTSAIRADMRIDVSQPSLPADLIGYWRFTEGTGTTVADISGNANDGVLSGSTLPTWADGNGPYNYGTAANLIMLCCAPSSFTAARVTITPSVISTPEVFVASKLECDPGGTQPTGSNSYNFGYWVIDRYVQAVNYSASMTFFVDSNMIDPADLVTDFVLYNRSANDTGAWTQVGTATTFDAAAHSITFLTGATTGQFVIGANGNTLLSVKNSVKNTFSFYPNPAAQLVNIQFSNEGNHVIELNDLQGRILISQHVSGSTYFLDISAIHPGIYCLTSDGSAKQFIITR